MSIGKSVLKQEYLSNWTAPVGGRLVSWIQYGEAQRKETLIICILGLRLRHSSPCLSTHNARLNKCGLLQNDRLRLSTRIIPVVDPISAGKDTQGYCLVHPVKEIEWPGEVLQAGCRFEHHSSPLEMMPCIPTIVITLISRLQKA